MNGRWVAVAAVALVVVAGIGYVLGSSSNSGDSSGNRSESLFGDAALEELAAEKDQKADSEEFLPPTRENLLALLAEENEDVPDPNAAVIKPYGNEMPDVPSTDLAGRPTGDDPSQWFNVEYCDEGGGISSWDVNPYTVNAFQSSLRFSTGGPSC